MQFGQSIVDSAVNQWRVVTQIYNSAKLFTFLTTIQFTIV